MDIIIHFFAATGSLELRWLLLVTYVELFIAGTKHCKAYLSESNMAYNADSFLETLMGLDYGL